MGKAARRRVRSRRNYLSELAQTDPHRFKREWANRLPDMAREARRYADRLVDHEGKQTPNPFSVVRKAEVELREIGPKAVKLEGASTKEALSAECTRAWRRAVAPSILRREEK